MVGEQNVSITTESVDSTTPRSSFIENKVLRLLHDGKIDQDEVLLLIQLKLSCIHSNVCLQL